ncbi:MAG TPA: lysophospholipid acyltransferase family protein [Candidatus Hydrogenedentes bacterium]|nr:lysophospholipid acyltransferase family protein [Candidatus Hydrogenedentota bacterium]HOL75756.1 lysophospholipid acyltransferase family protein [Candidatus Hydrogenedentota bacterium]HPO84251.1 lysophospholipid acyltransferase family protein [Candidatus Hydrogenedentota bacterium]
MEDIEGVPLGFKKSFILATFPVIASTLLKTIGITSREVVQNKSIFTNCLKNHGSLLLAFWHETLALALWHFRYTGYATLTSLSFDGELAARVAQKFGFHVMRGSSTKGGPEAITQLLQAINVHKVAGLTIDGPKGPRRIAKPGIAILSKKRRIPVIPVALYATPCWRLRSWDRMIIPKPFCRIQISYGEPVIPTSSTRIEDIRIEIEQRLNSAQDLLEKGMI